MISVSVILPCYNMKDYIDQCMDSLINQTLKNIEIILVNDASQDCTLEILRRYEKQHENVIVIDSPINLKQGGARNLGMDIAKGKYIGFVDPDDWINGTMYEKLYHFAEENNYEFVKCYHSRVQKIFNNVNTVTLGNDASIIDFTEPKNSAVYKKLSDVRYAGFAIWDSIFDREFLAANKIRFPEHVFHEDAYFSFFTDYFASRKGTFKEVLYYYLLRYNSTESKRNDISSCENLLTSIRMLLKEITAREILDKDKDKIEEYFINRYYVASYTTILNFDTPPAEFLKNLSKLILRYFPDYQKNKYCIEGTELHKTILQILRLNDIDPLCLCNTIQEDEELRTFIHEYASIGGTRSL